MTTISELENALKLTIVARREIKKILSEDEHRETADNYLSDLISDLKFYINEIDEAQAELYGEDMNASLHSYLQGVQI